MTSDGVPVDVNVFEYDVHLLLIRPNEPRARPYRGTRIVERSLYDGLAKQPQAHSAYTSLTTSRRGLSKDSIIPSRFFWTRYTALSIVTFLARSQYAWTTRS